jgi:small subunit ribosomal protein S1
MSESFADLFEESQKRSETRIGEVVTAEVVRIEHNFVVVNAGLKSEAYVPLSEFKSDKGELEVQVGEFVSVAIVAMENGYGDTIVSRDTAKRLASWMSLEKSLEYVQNYRSLYFLQCNNRLRFHLLISSGHTYIHLK